ncbi:multidrug effflux MFS transporter [Pseudoduganella namucuonensis]|uniref:Bcr/CflA family efflux transporter n=1 Tax=Pseudoduganella namucuonensis TaxID=1035707 RepID=A0A1I7M0Z4_9BURK|nr:multidrug effflux MFS transporter [Pseudoduganella namucuonensis]SFV15642.1 MFS transporter, DHA1 family, bicyclomycin/chloramphenicol resistance protein [Pseudoduganella namucuonensis]
MLPDTPAHLPSDDVAVPPPEPSHKKPLPRFALACVLASLSMLGPFSIDAYLPAFPNIQASLHATPIEVQQTLTAYMLAFAAMVLWHGALSDAFGRRNVVLVSLVLFAIGTMGCAAASSVHYLWFFRVLQGVSAGAGVVVGRAIIRDLYADAQAARLLSMVTMIFAIAPAVAPVLGGMIVKHLDWRAIFLFLFVYTVLLFIVCYRRLPETLPPHKRQPFNPKFLARNYGSILRSPLFHMKSGVVALNFAGLFVFITAAPEMLPNQLHLGPDQFGWLFIPAVAGIFLGALAANRIAGKISFARQIGVGFGFMLAAAGCNVAFHLLHAPALPWTVAPLFFYSFGMSVVGPAATLLGLDLFPHLRGTAASCQSFSVTLLGAVVAGAIAPALGHSVLWLAYGQLAFTMLALALWLTSRVYRRMLLRHPAG